MKGIEVAGQAGCDQEAQIGCVGHHGGATSLQYKDPEAGSSLVHWRNQMEINVAETKWMNGRVTQDYNSERSKCQML